METKLTRRSFLGFFLIGGLFSMLAKRFGPKSGDRVALFWREHNGS